MAHSALTMQSDIGYGSDRNVDGFVSMMGTIIWYSENNITYIMYLYVVIGSALSV